MEKEKYKLIKEQKEAERGHIEQKKKIKKIIKIILILIATGFVFWGIWIYGSRSSKKLTNREVALSCTTDMATQFHIHPHLEIIIDGKQQTIPANIGISFDCMHPLHTHDSSGTIHIESPEARDFTLSDFFAVWGKTFNKNQILDSVVDQNHQIKVTINGNMVDTYENTIMHDGDLIKISYEEKK